MTREVPSPFLVIATQNPAGTTGTQYLPEAQVDRFMVCLSLGYPDYESELAMAKGIGPDEKYRMIQPVLTGGMLQDMQKEIYQVYMKDSVYEYLEKEQGLKIGYATKEISVQNAGEIDRRYLDLGSYDLVVVVVGYTYTLDGRVFQYTESRHRPDHFRFVGVAQR